MVVQHRAPAPQTAVGDDDSKAEESPGRAASPRSGRRQRWRHRWLGLLVLVAPVLVSGALRLLAKTVRIRYVNADEIFGRWARGERLILAFWHNRLVMMPIAAAGRGRQLCIMNSQSRDGEIATRALARWGIRSVRGSATRGGAGGFMQLVNAYRRGDDLAVVPDGPRGPRYVVKRGVIHLARATGAPIVPVTYAASRTWQLRSWDRLIIPRPLARVVYVAGEPLGVPRHAGEDEVEALRLELETRLNAITQIAETEVRTAG
jgi:lysophospholipid acyltransferase (LPLAT)-like uncharacterized protein